MVRGKVKKILVLTLIITFYLTIFVPPGLEVISSQSVNIKHFLDEEATDEISSNWLNDSLETGSQDFMVSSIKLDPSLKDDVGFYNPLDGTYYNGPGWLVEDDLRNYPSDRSRDRFHIMSDGTIVVPDDYSSIQAAVNASAPGDTIYVTPGIYYERVVVGEFNLTLIGADVQSTIIDGGGWGDVVKITNSSVTFSNFSVRNGNIGVKIEGLSAFNNTVSGNRIFGNKVGVYLLRTLENNITVNKIVSNSRVGIGVDGGGGNLVYNNYFSNEMNVYDTNGGETWKKTYGGLGDDFARSIVETSDGGYALAGYTGSYGAGNGDFWLVKTDSDGNHLWNKTYGGSSYDEASSVIETRDGGYVLVGYTNSFGAGSNDSWLVKTDSDGNHLWNMTYGGTSNDVAGSVVETSDGGYALAGYTGSYGAGNGDFWLVKTDSAGNHLWNMTYGGSDDDRARSVVKTNDGGYVLAGYTSSFGVDVYDFWLVKTDADGVHQWNKTYGSAYDDAAWSVIETSDGGYSLAGKLSSNDSTLDFWLVKVDSNGNHCWNETFGGVNDEEAYSVVETSDGGYALAGYTNSFGADSYGFWLVKTYPPGGVHEANSWNISKKSGLNIIGGSSIAGNCWNDYPGVDLNGDWIGDTYRPYNSSGFIQEGGDMMPLTRVINLDSGFRYSSIQSAIDAPDTLVGHTLLAPAGIYNETVTVDKQIAIEGSDQALSNISPLYLNDAAFTMGEANITITGFSIRSNSHAEIGNNTGIVLADTAQQCTITDNNITCSVGIRAEPSSHNNTITGNYFESNQYGIILIEAHNNTIAQNNFESNTVAIELHASSDIIIINNTILDNNLGITLDMSEKNRIYNNIFSNQANAIDRPCVNTITYSAYEGPSYNHAYCVVENRDGDYIIAGTSTPPAPGPSDADFWLVKTDADGNQLWNKTFGGSQNDYADAVVETHDGDYIIAGTSTPPGSIDTDFWLVKTDADGNQLWNKTFGGSQNEFARSVVETGDGDYVIAGTRWIIDPMIGPHDFWLVKTDADGNQLWNKTFGGSQDDFAHSVVETGDGGYAIAGHTLSSGAGGQDFWLVKTDADGNQLWNKTFGGSQNDQAYSVVETGDGGYAFAGITYSFGAGGYDFWLVKTDTNGNQLATMTFGGSGDDGAESVIETSDGGIAIVGYTTSFGADWRDALLVNVPFTPNLWNITKTWGVNLVGGEYVGGNYWSDYEGIDVDGDGLGDTPYSKGMLIGADYRPLVRVRNLDTARGYAKIQAAIDDPETEDGHTISVYGGLYIENVDVHKNLTITGAGADITKVKAANPSDHVFDITASNVNLTGFTLTNAKYLHAGVYLKDVQNCNISNNHITDNFGGIYLINTLNCHVSNNSITESFFGIKLANGTTGNTITFNNIDSYILQGFSIESSSQNLIINNTLSGASIGIYFQNPESYYNTVEDNKVNEETYYHYVNLHDQTINDLTLTGEGVSNLGKISVIGGTNITFNNLSLANGTAGLFLYKTNSSHIGILTPIHAERNTYGILMTSCNNNAVINSSFMFNAYGIELRTTEETNITGNNFHSNSRGIYLQASLNNNITRNSVTGNHDGICLEHSNTNIINENLLGNETFGNANGVFLNSSVNNTFVENNITRSSVGIRIQNSTNNTFTNTVMINTFHYWIHFSDSSIHNILNDVHLEAMTVSLDCKDVSMKTLYAIPPEPASPLASINKYVDIRNTTMSSWIFLNITYTESELDNVLEESLGIYSYNGTSWNFIPRTNGVNTMENYAYANITGFSPYGVFGYTVPVLVVNKTSPAPLKGLSYHTSIQSAVSYAESHFDHARIIVCRGTYAENILVQMNRINITSRVGMYATTVVGDGSTHVFTVRADEIYIEGFTIRGAGSNYAAVYLDGADYGRISGNNVSLNSYGIQLFQSSNNHITLNNVILNSEEGIYLTGSSRNIVSGNNASLNGGDGIYLHSDSDNNILTDNILHQNNRGICLYSSDGNNMTGNELTGLQQLCGIFLNYSNQCNIDDNFIGYQGGFEGETLLNATGIYILESDSNGIFNNVVLNNTLAGIQTQQSQRTWIVSNRVGFTRANVTHGRIGNSTYGIFINFSTAMSPGYANTIIDNSVSYVHYGVRLQDSRYTRLVGNDVFNNYYGFFLWTASRSLLANNTVTNNFGIGVYLDWASSHNTIDNNEVNGNFYGITIYGSIYANSSANKNVISDNNVNNNVALGIFLNNKTSHNTVTDNTVMYNGDFGVFLNDTTSNIIAGNTLSNNTMAGIFLNVSSFNSIEGNTIWNHKVNVALFNSSHNRIYHNNFGMWDDQWLNAPYWTLWDDITHAREERGTNNLWDYGYPAGGNYWANFTEWHRYNYTRGHVTDEGWIPPGDDFWGPYQNLSRSDGIWDLNVNGSGFMCPFTIKPDFNKDRYPLRYPLNLGYVLAITAERLDEPTYLVNVQLQNSKRVDIPISDLDLHWIDTSDPPALSLGIPSTVTDSEGRSINTGSFRPMPEPPDEAIITVVLTGRHEQYLFWNWTRAEQKLVRFRETPEIIDAVQRFANYFLHEVTFINEFRVNVTWKRWLSPWKIIYDVENGPFIELDVTDNVIVPDRTRGVPINSTHGQIIYSPSIDDPWPREGWAYQNFDMSQFPIGNNIMEITAVADLSNSSIKEHYFYILKPHDDLKDSEWTFHKTEIYPGHEENIEYGERYVQYKYDEDLNVFQFLSEVGFSYFNAILGNLTFSIPEELPFIGGDFGPKFSDNPAFSIVDRSVTYNSRYGTAEEIAEIELEWWLFGGRDAPLNMETVIKKGIKTALSYFTGIPIPDVGYHWYCARGNYYVPVGNELKKDETIYNIFLRCMIDCSLPISVAEGVEIDIAEDISLGFIDFGATLETLIFTILIEKRNPSTDRLHPESLEAGYDLTLSAWGKADLLIAGERREIGGHLGVTYCIDETGDLSMSSGRVGLFAKYKVHALWYEFFWGRKWTWDFVTNEVYVEVLSNPHPPGWHPMDRNYINDGYSRFVGNLGIGHSSPTSETMLIQNVFPNSDLSLAVNENDNLILAYVYDDPSKNMSESFEICYTMWDGYQWSEPEPITNNYLTDVKPAVIYDSEGNAVAVWTTINNQTLPANITDLNKIIKYGEIAYSTFDPSTRTWTAPQLLTNNNVFDYAPSLAADQNGNVMAMWQVDQDNNITKSPLANTTYSMEKDYYYSMWNGSSWTSPAPALENIDIVDSMSFDLDDGTAIAVWSQDTDGNSTTREDIEIYYSTWDGATWNIPVRFTTDSKLDKLPSVSYMQDGNPLVTWVKDEVIENNTIDNIYFSRRDGGWSTPVSISETNEVDSLKLVKDSQKNPVLIWQQVSNKRSEIFYSVYDKDHDSWSLKNSLTSDNSTESDFTPVITSENEIVSAYLKGNIAYKNETYEYWNGTELLWNITKPAQHVTSHDMYLLRHPIAKDLEVTSHDITLSTANPAPGETITINATIHNTGDLSLDNVEVKFQDGVEGPQIGYSQTISTINAGESKTVSTEWTVPSAPTTHDIYVLVDPINEIAERNETNNNAYITTVLPDLIASGTSATSPVDSQPGEMVINATISNTGYVAASNIPVSFYLSESTNFGNNKTLIATQTMDTLDAGTSQILTIPWNTSTLDPGNYYLFTAIDENDTILEGYKTNNLRVTPVKIAPDISLNNESITLSSNIEGDITINMTVFNHGDFDVENVTVQAYTSSPYYLNSTTNTIMLNTTAALFNETIPYLLSKTNTTITRIWNTHPNDYNLHLIVDPKDNIQETNELNNLAVKTTRILQNLSLTSLEAVDTDEDGLFNHLEAKIEANIPRAGYHLLTGNLTDNTGKQITTAADLQYLMPGTQNLTLLLNGVEIRQHAADGQYTLKDIRLYDQTSLMGLLLQPQTTSPYSHTQFQTPSGTLENIISDQGIDTDDNGYYEFLEVEANINVTEAGNYNTQAILRNNEGNYTAWAQNSTYLPLGVQAVKLRFYGPDIFSHGIDGPYNLSEITIYNDNWDMMDHERNAYTTSAYSYTDFEGGTANVAVTSVTPMKNVVGQGFTMRINATVANLGFAPETFNVTVYYDSNPIETHTIIDLPQGEEATITFDWNTTGITKGNYTITVQAQPVSGEADITDNTKSDGWVIIAIVGDITGPEGYPDGKCDMRDIGLVARHFGQSAPPAPANCDLTGPTTGVPDGKIDMRDIGLVARHFAETDP